MTGDYMDSFLRMIADDASKSSLIAGSIAQQLMGRQDIIDRILDKIDKEKLMSMVANIIVERKYLFYINNTTDNITSMAEKIAAERLADRISSDVLSA